MRLQYASVLLVLLIPVVALGEDDPRAARRAAADRIVRMHSATPATGPLPPPAPVAEPSYSPGLWVNAARQWLERMPKRPTPAGKGDDLPDLESDDDMPFEELHEPAKAYDIPSLRAKVTGLRFYEAGFDNLPLDQRLYAGQFETAATRAIWWELGLTYPAPTTRKTFRLEIRWRRQDGSVLADEVSDQQIETGWTSSFHAQGRGAQVPATWDRGTYSVQVFLEGKIIASGTFAVTSTAELRNVQLHHNREDNSGQKGVVIAFEFQTWRRRGQETYVGAYVQFQDGTPLRDLDGQFKDAGGFVATVLAFHPQGDDTRWPTAQIFFPYAQMHLARGTHELRVQLVAYEPKTAAALAHSSYIPMSLTWN